MHYPFGGLTALFDAVVSSVDRVVAHKIERRFVVAMTDGRNNSYSATLEEAITRAVDPNVPVYTVGFGDGVNVGVLDDIATRTGASNFQVNDTDIGNPFQSIQSGIGFQYIARSTNTNLDETMQLSIELDFNGLQATRDVDL